ncbi:hypothetical protein ABFS82_04G180700 [Erythranthe guttata]|uniref:M-phase phosphoprotein 6 n=1 Tax=Erythranthe guttata TaxID=4155 RepID=A0A022PRN3_ERYGU|nr:PREDICTED: uncharacterized protein LOC105949133 [Erythranthe guttata]EYU18992.1 hypothetical protein MIMGU_mgv1a014676mg [Erythranthe guttata]|eukprot:XP_012827862.1 PREDICTED: uncharacterized protein LOC105949133 [Erythranthe guttata]
MAKRELSSTLKNLKFMQRVIQKDEKAEKEEEVMPAGDFPRSAAVKRCVVVVEGDPHPGVTRGRMSFLSFNPSIDKLNEVASDSSETESAATSSGRQNEAIPIRENGGSVQKLDKLEVDANDDLKRKQAQVFSEEGYPNKSRKNDQENQDSPQTSSRSPQKRNKREKLDWSVLRPPKYQSKKR